jgi:branched-chain amino acid transport system substrate-binding protein
MQTIAIFAMTRVVLANLPIGVARADETTGATNKSIKIGMFGPVTGPSSAQAKALYGAVAIYKDINDRGGINGRQLELVIEDDGCDANKGVAAAKKLISQDKVFPLHDERRPAKRRNQ